MKYGAAIILFLFVFESSAQVEEAEPVGGVEALKDLYRGLTLTPGQREQSKEGVAELLFRVDRWGGATLLSINGVEDPGLLDSLYRRSTILPTFRPRLENGIPVGSRYQMVVALPDLLGIGETERIIQTSSSRDRYFRKEMLLGLGGNMFMGNAAEYLAPGFGGKGDFILGGEKYGIGFSVSVFGNHRMKEYPIVTARPQEDVILSGFIGFNIQHTFYKEERRELSLQLDLCYAVQDIVRKLNDADKDYVTFRGFSPALTANYNVQLGEVKRATIDESRFVSRYSYLNFYISIRSLYLSQDVASGLMIDAGVAYRLRMVSDK